MAVGDDEKPKIRCLDARHYAVAFTVAVIVAVVIVHAVVTVLRPGDLIVRLDGGHVSMNVSKLSPPTLTIKFTLQAINSSGRVRIYFTDILANISRSLMAEDFVLVEVDGFAVGQQDSLEVIAGLSSTSDGMLPDAFGQLFRGSSIGNAILKQSGNCTVETYAGHNDTAKRVLNHCPFITVGAEEPQDAHPYVPCAEQQLPARGST